MKGSTPLAVTVAALVLVTALGGTATPRDRQPAAAAAAAPAADPWRRLPGILAGIRAPVFPERDCPVTRFGAVSDGTTDASAAFRSAIDACHRAGGFMPVVRDLLLERLSVRSADYALFIRGLPGSPVRGVLLRDSVLGGVRRGIRLEHVEELGLRNVTILPAERQAAQEETR